jgi:hypothetical protein
VLHDGYKFLEQVQQFDSKEKLFSIITTGFISRQYSTGLVRMRDYGFGQMTVTIGKVMRLRNSG